MSRRWQIELADAAPESAARRLTFVFAGAGFAGVEVVAELHELVADWTTAAMFQRDVAELSSPTATC